MDRENSPEVFRGHLDECLKYFRESLVSRRPKASRQEIFIQKQKIADFCGVQVKSVSKWLLAKGPRPIGGSLFKLMCYLDTIGYRVIELERLSKARRGFLELIGFGIISNEQAVEYLGYSAISTLNQILKGQYGTSEDREQKMWNLWKARREELERRKEALKQSLGLGVSPDDSPKIKEPMSPILPMRQAALLNIMEGLLTLLENEPFDKISENGSARLQQSANTMLRLSAHLSALSSRLIMSEQRKGVK